MHIEIIDDLRRFDELRENWNQVYDADPEAQFFLSAVFMRDWLPRLEGPWFILAAKPSADATRYVAFLPLRLRTKERKGGGYYNEINMAGNYCADYTGLICEPQAEKAAIPALARHLTRLPWTHLNLDNFAASEPRLSAFMAQFSDKNFALDDQKRINAKDNVDNCVCPFAMLPDSWERYLGESLSANTRQKIRRLLRQVEADPEYRVTLANMETIERDLKILLNFWAAKWAARKGTKLRTLVPSNYMTFQRAFQSGALLLPVLWKGERPLGALATFIDSAKRSLLFYLAGRDEAFDGPSPGLVLHAWSIRYAIENGFVRYDFLRGNEAYKYSFGVQEHRIKCIRVSTRSGRNIGDRLDPRCLPEVIQRTTEQHQAGKLAEAERGYRQVLDVSPRDPTVLYRFAQLMITRGKLVAARRAYKSLVALRPDSYKAWLGLAGSLQALNRFSEAAHAYNQVIRLRPDIAAAHRNLGQMLITLGRHGEATGAFRAALTLQPNDRIAENGLALASRMETGALEQARVPAFGRKVDRRIANGHPTQRSLLH